MRKSTIKAWAIKYPECELSTIAISFDAADTRANFTKTYPIVHPVFGKPIARKTWKQLYAEGYRCVPVIIREQK